MGRSQATAAGQPGARPSKSPGREGSAIRPAGRARPAIETAQTGVCEAEWRASATEVQQPHPREGANRPQPAMGCRYHLPEVPLGCGLFPVSGHRCLLPDGCGLAPERRPAIRIRPAGSGHGAQTEWEHPFAHASLGPGGAVPLRGVPGHAEAAQCEHQHVQPQLPPGECHCGAIERHTQSGMAV